MRTPRFMVLVVASACGCTATIVGDEEGAPGSPSDRPDRPDPGAAAAGGPGLAPGGTPAPSGFTTPKEAIPLDRRIWRLTRAQYNNTVKDLLGDTTGPASAFDPESGGTGFLNAEAPLGLGASLMDQVNKAAARLAQETLGNPMRTQTYLHSCLALEADKDACAKDFVAKFGRRAFRRPLTAEELGAYNGLHTTYKAKLDGKTAVQLVIEAMLQSPSFLFRTELGDGRADARGRVTLTPHEVAASLSYYLTDSMPDAELASAADNGSIMMRPTLDTHARRLLGTDRAKAALWEMFGQMLQYEDLAMLDAKAGTGAKDFDAAKKSLAKETETFLRELVWNDDAAFAKLLSAPYTFVDSPLAKIYGQPDPGAGKWAKVMLDGKDRAGILTQTGLMAILAHPDQSSPVLRGKFVVERILCRELPEPPPGQDVQPPKLAANQTTRQRYEALTETPGSACAPCHRMVNPAGYTFEHLDWVGKVRRTEGTLPLNTRVDISGAGDVDGTFANVGELAAKLGQSADARRCLARQLFRFANGKLDGKDDEGAVTEMVTAFGKGGWNIRDLLLSHISSERFVTRKAVN